MVRGRANHKDHTSGCWFFGHIATNSSPGNANIHQLSFHGANNCRMARNARRSPSPDGEWKKDAQLQTGAWRKLLIAFKENTGSTYIDRVSLVPHSFATDAVTNRYSQIKSDRLRLIPRFSHAPSSPFPLSNSGSRD